MRLALDGRAGIEQAGDDGRVDVGHIAFERRGAVHHRHAGDADIVLHRDRLALELARRRALDVGLHVPGVERVLLGARPIAGRARIFDHRDVVGHLIEQIVGGEIAFHQREELADALRRHAHAEAVDDVHHLLEGRASDGHWARSSSLRIRGRTAPEASCDVVAGSRSVVHADEFVDEAVVVQLVGLGRAHDRALLDDQHALATAPR